MEKRWYVVRVTGVQNAADQHALYTAGIACTRAYAAMYPIVPQAGPHAQQQRPRQISMRPPSRSRSCEPARGAPPRDPVASLGFTPVCQNKHQGGPERQQIGGTPGVKG